MDGIMPIIRLEIEGMKQQICIALSEYSMQMDKDIQTAVDAYCTPENITRIVRQAAFNALNYVIKEEVDKFFRYGEGRKAVAEAVKGSILNKETFTPLDDV